MRHVEFHTLLLGGSDRGHRVFISTLPGQSQLLGAAERRLPLRVNVNGHVFDAEAWPVGEAHLIEVPEELVDAARLRGGDPARVSLHLMGAPEAALSARPA